MRAEDVLEFWFGDGSTAIAEKKGLWFRASDELDAEIRARFGSAVEAALAGGFGEWLATARGRLALIILLDQFTRNIYRGSGVAFSGDLLAQRYCLDGLERGDDRSLSPYERVFFYLPLEHAEDLALQERSVALFENNLKSAKKTAAETDAASFLDYARRHRDVIAEFGRFPHRNSRLGRETRHAERVFLERPGSSFG